MAARRGPNHRLPGGVDHLLARMVQQINDHCCEHSGNAALCPKCSMMVLDLAHNCISTAPAESRPWELQPGYIEVGLALVRSVRRFADDRRLVRVQQHCSTWVSQAPTRWAAPGSLRQSIRPTN